MKRQLAVHQSYCYAEKVIKNEIPVPKYVIKQCQKFLEICDGKFMQVSVAFVRSCTLCRRGARAGVVALRGCENNWPSHAEKAKVGNR